MKGSILYTTNHLRTDYCQKKVKEFRESIKANQSTYKRVALVDKLVEDGIQYNRIRLYY